MADPIFDLEYNYRQIRSILKDYPILNNDLGMECIGLAQKEYNTNSYEWTWSESPVTSIGRIALTFLYNKIHVEYHELLEKRKNG